MIDNFLSLLVDAHQLRVDQPCYPISPNLGRELAAMALESKRLADAVEWLWHRKPDPSGGDAPALSRSRPALLMMRLVVRLDQSDWGHKLIQNPRLKAAGKWLVAKTS
jgi:hypothetical protein